MGGRQQANRFGEQTQGSEQEGKEAKAGAPRWRI